MKNITSHSKLLASLFLLFFIFATGCKNPLGTGSSSNIESDYHPGAPVSTGPESFSWVLPFTEGTESGYLFNDVAYATSLSIDFSGNKARIKPADQIDNFTNVFTGSTLNGVQVDTSNSMIRLDSTTNQSEFDSSWTPQWSDLVAYWKMNNSWTDSTTFGNTATAAGDTSFSSTIKKMGTHSGSFDGTGDYLDISSVGNDMNANKGTVSLWIYREYADTSNVGFLKLSVDANNYLEIKYNAATQDIRSGFSASGVKRTADSHSNPGMNTWFHVIVTWDNSINSMKLYINGVLEGTRNNLNGAVAGTVSSGQIGHISSVGYHLGKIDDVAIWKTNLSEGEVQSIYSRQVAKYSGWIRSRVMDAASTGSTLQNWTSLAMITNFPFYKELPVSASETSTHYPSVGGGLIADLIGLWRFNDGAGSATAADSTGNGNDLTATSIVFSEQVGPLGGFASSISSGGLQASTSDFNFSGRAPFSFSLWFRTSMTSGSFNILSIIGTNGSGNQGWNLGLDVGTGAISFLRHVDSATLGPSYVGTAHDGQWHHLAGIYDGNNTTMYLDGVLRGGSISDTRSLVSAATTFGVIVGAGQVGSVDDLGIWSRALTANEVKELFRRSANRIKYQVRSCNNVDCSDQDALTTTGQGWKGPGNTYLNYFSELYNTSGNLFSGTVLDSSPVMDFTQFAGLNVDSKRYFQYRAILESDDSNALCTYSGSSAPCSPELKSVSVGPDHYSSTVQTISSKTSIGTSYITLDTNGFTETLGTNGCTSGVKYSLSPNGAIYYYWDGSSWAISSGYSDTNDAATIRSNISSFPNSIAGTGTLHIKSYLKSDGTTACELNSLQVTGVR